MSERGVGKPWTTYEDNLLIQAVAIHGENDNWKAVATSIPGRTNKACRKRWLHSLSPNVKKSAWTPEEDQLLLSLYATHGTKWSVIARHISGRTDDACSKRYREALDPSLKRDDWTNDEDAKLMDAYSRLGGKWGLIGQELNRSGLGCRNRWRMLERRRAAHSRDAASRGEPSSSVTAPSGTPSQWTETHVQEEHFWDGRSPQYVTPSVLYQGSPPHPQEPHSTSYSPEEILSGAHLNGSPSTSRDPPPFQYSSSSLSAALSHPSSVTQSPNPHGYYSTAAFSPDHAPELSDINVPASDAPSRTYGSQDYQFIPIDDHHDQSTPEPFDHIDGQTPIRATELADEYTGPSAPAVAIAQVSGIPSDSSASPAQGGPPSPLRSPPSSPSQTVCVADPSRLPDLSCAPRSYYRTDAEKSRKDPAPRRLNSQRPTRLSSNLPAATDATVLAYACGHRDCWPADSSNSRSAFSTSKELSDHSKADHNGDLGGSKPFRCGLTGCEKSWKSINGLQYHLQISRYHFQEALAGRPDIPLLSAPASSENKDASNDATSPPGRSTSNPESSNTINAEPTTLACAAPTHEDASEEIVSEKHKRKLHPCPRPGCNKTYKQLSGLRYHLTHGHVDTLPMQLTVVPPTLARMVAAKGSAPRL